MCSLTSSPEQRIPEDYPLRSLPAMTDEALQQLKPRFDKVYAKDRTALDSGFNAIANEKRAVAECRGV